MSDRMPPSRESVTIIRSESNGPLYLLVVLLALAAVGVVYWATASHWHYGPTSTTTVIMPAPAPDDMRPGPNREPPAGRTPDAALAPINAPPAPAPQGQAPVLIPQQ